MRRAAFFDIDGTLVRTDLMTHHFKQLLRFEVIDESVWFGELRDLYALYEKRQDDYDRYMDAFNEVYRVQLKGVDIHFNQYIVRQGIEKYGDMVYRCTREALQKHHEMGDAIFFISGSPDFLVREMAKKYNVTDYRASVYEIKDNVFTGEVIRAMWDSVNKNKALDELIRAYHIDMDASFAYGDTGGDYSMLRRAGHPVAINPSKKLLLKMKEDLPLRNKITILVERKDVIYQPAFESIRDLE